MKYAILIALLFFGCSSPSEPPTEPNKYDEFYRIAERPNWPLSSIEGVWEYGNTRIENGWFYTTGLGEQASRVMEVRRSDNELWFQTLDGEFRFRGVEMSDQIIGRMVRIDRGRPGPIYSAQYKRAR